MNSSALNLSGCAVRIEEHARWRMQARRIPRDGIEAAWHWGSIWRSFQKWVMRIDRRAIAQAAIHGENICPFEGITIVVDDEGELTTVYRNRHGRRRWR